MKAALEPQFKRTIVGRTKHSGSTAACLYKILNIHNIYTPKAGKEYIGFLVWFDLCICSCSCSVGGRFTISSSLSFVLTLHAIVLAFEWNFVETAFVNNITTITILFNCATAIVCEMQLDLVSAGKIWAVKCNCLQPAMTFTRCSWRWRFWGKGERKAVWWKPTIAIVITVRNIKSTTTSTSSSNNTSWHQ